jgi:hypothetical protein
MKWRNQKMKVYFDTYNIKQYENERIIEHSGELIEKGKYFSLVYSPTLRSNILVPTKELREVLENESL